MKHVRRILCVTDASSELRPASQLPKTKQPERSIAGMCRSQRTIYRSWKHLTIQDWNIYRIFTIKKLTQKTKKKQGKDLHHSQRCRATCFWGWVDQGIDHDNLRFDWSLLKSSGASFIYIIYINDDLKKNGGNLKPSENSAGILEPSSFSCFFCWSSFFPYGFKVSTFEWTKRCNKQLTVETVDLFHHRAVEGPQQQCLQRYWRRGQALASCDCRKGKP